MTFPTDGLPPCFSCGGQALRAVPVGDSATWHCARCGLVDFATVRDDAGRTRKGFAVPAEAAQLRRLPIPDLGDDTPF